MSEYLISEETLASIRRTCYEAGKAGREVFTVRRPSTEIVRCRDCEHYFDRWGCCMRNSHWVTFYEPDGGNGENCEGMAAVEPDGYCAWGERKA